MPEKIGEIIQKGSEEILRPRNNIELERALFEKYKLNPSHELEEKILKEYCDIVDKVISRFLTHKLVKNKESRQDIHQIGQVALLTAIRTYQLPLGIKNEKLEERRFYSYAYSVIWNKLTDQIRNHNTREKYIIDVPLVYQDHPDDYNPLLEDKESSEAESRFLNSEEFRSLVGRLARKEDKLLIWERYHENGQIKHTFVELGEKYGLSPQAMLGRVKRILRNLWKIYVEK